MENARVNAFATQLQIVQYRVNYYYAKGEDAYKDFGTNITPEIQTKIENGVGLNSLEGYKYYDKDGLKALGVEDVDIPIIINFSTRDVIGINGVKKNGNMCYRLEELGESYNVEYVGPTNDAAPTFVVGKTINGLNATINISNITYNGTVNRGTVYFGEVTNENTDPITVNYWQEIGTNTININKSGTYAVKVVDNLGNQDIQSLKITLANAPKLTEGMLKFINGNDNYTDNYDYADDNSWALAQKDGNTYVWVPRYAYKGNNIKFLRGNLDIPTDNIVVEGYTTNSSFTIENREITGMWVRSTSNIIQEIQSNPDEEITGDIIIPE